MNQQQKRQRILRLRKQQKENQKAKRPRSKTITREDVVGILGLVRRFMKSDKEFVDEYSWKANKKKRVGIFLLAVGLLLNMALYFNLILLSDEWDAPLFFFSVFIVLMPWTEYLIYRERIPFWKKEFRENSEYARDLEKRLSTFR